LLDCSEFGNFVITNVPLFVIVCGHLCVSV
jgi:hypothetical protein